MRTPFFQTHLRLVKSQRVHAVRPQSVDTWITCKEVGNSRKEGQLQLYAESLSQNLESVGYTLFTDASEQIDGSRS
jgi:hypothetical protein